MGPVIFVASLSKLFLVIFSTDIGFYYKFKQFLDGSCDICGFLLCQNYIWYFFKQTFILYYKNLNSFLMDPVIFVASLSKLHMVIF